MISRMLFILWQLQLIFNEATRLVLLSRKWRKSQISMTEISNNNIKIKKLASVPECVAAIILIASASSFFRLRLDLTEDKRYTLSGPTRKVLSGLKNDIYIQVYLDGEMPIPLKN